MDPKHSSTQHQSYTISHLSLLPVVLHPLDGVSPPLLAHLNTLSWYFLCYVGFTFLGFPPNAADPKHLLLGVSSGSQRLLAPD